MFLREIISSSRILSFLVILATGFSSQVFAQAPTTVLLFGDSIIAGYGLAEEDSLTAQLQSYMIDKGKDVNVINGGVSGDTTSAGLTRLAWTLKRKKPDVVVLALGGNDVLRGIPPTTTRQNLDGMLKILKDTDVDIVFSRVQAPTSLGLDYSQQLNAAYDELAKKYSLSLYPFLLEEIFAKPGLMLNDGIHPSASGVKVIAKQLGDYLIR